MKLPAILALWGGTAVIVILSLFPPWYVVQLPVNGQTVVYVDQGHALIFDPPRMPNGCPFVNLTALVPLWVAAGSLTLAAVVTLNRE